MKNAIDKELRGRWCGADGERINCNEKLKVMEENLREIKELLQDAIDDAVLMGCSEESFKKVYEDALKELHSQFPEQRHQKGEEK